jgi:hypothetical protein
VLSCLFLSSQDPASQYFAPPEVTMGKNIGPLASDETYTKINVVWISIMSSVMAVAMTLAFMLLFVSLFYFVCVFVSVCVIEKERASK